VRLHLAWYRAARRWLVGMGRTVLLLCVVATCAEPPVGVLTQDTGLTLVPGDPTAFSSSESCLEPACVLVQGAYISHFTEPNCQGVEHYYTRYTPVSARRSWNGTGVTGGILRTVTNKSWKRWDGACFDDWPTGHTLPDMVRIYRGPPGVCEPSGFVLSGNSAPETPGNYDYAAPHDFPSNALCALPTAKTITWTRDGQVQSQCADSGWCSVYVTAGPSFTMGVTITASNSVNTRTVSRTLAVTNNAKCSVGLSVAGPSQPPGAGSYTYTASASAGECGGPFSYTWTQNYQFTTGSVSPCANTPTCTIAYTPSNPFTLVVTASRTWRDGSTWTTSSEIPVSSQFTVGISGPTTLSNTEWGTWNAHVFGGVAPFGWQWFVDGQAVPDNFSLSRSFWGESWHSIRVVAHDGLNQTAEHEISVYVGQPGSNCTYIVGCESERIYPATPSTIRRTRPTLLPPWVASPQSPFARP
jgi:hypothetical protein